MLRVLVELADRVYVATSRLYQTSSTVVVDRAGSALVIDPAWEPDELDSIASGVSALGVTDVVGVATHFHHDHLLWHPLLGDGPRWASPRTVAIVQEHRPELLGQLGESWPSGLAELFGRVEALTATRVPWPGPTAEVISHDAHAPGHLALWMPDLEVLICGDMLSDVELPLPASDDDGLAAYRAGLDALAPYVERAGVLIPGHGSPTTDPARRLAADRSYLDDVLTGRPSSDPRLRLPGMREADASTRALADLRSRP